MFNNVKGYSSAVERLVYTCADDHQKIIENFDSKICEEEKISVSYSLILEKNSLTRKD